MAMLRSRLPEANQWIAEGICSAYLRRRIIMWLVSVRNHHHLLLLLLLLLIVILLLLLSHYSHLNIRWRCDVVGRGKRVLSLERIGSCYLLPPGSVFIQAIEQELIKSTSLLSKMQFITEKAMNYGNRNVGKSIAFRYVYQFAFNYMACIAARSSH